MIQRKAVHFWSHFVFRIRNVKIVNIIRIISRDFNVLISINKNIK